ncbi:MAG: M56 family metallopeptidase [Chitinophagaceae bacterium]
MPLIFIYILKLSVSLSVMYLFYHLVLRKLTFYNWNRWYLLGYSLLSFVIPFIDITSALQDNELNNTSVIQWVPVLYKQSTGSTLLTFWNIILLVVIAGMLLMLTRLLIQLISFRQMMKKAKLISGDAINLYQVDESIIPFSFGNAVFFNVNLHTTEELEKIIRHEFVHVKQRHSIDIIFSEILCLLNWYNPFAWMIRAAIRQNLEFVADNQVLENGINKKQYQYLLLKVIGNNQFSISQKFNFTSLKKRIAMMNKNKSAKMHLLRFLFLLPVLAIILISFRKEISDTLTGKQNQSPQLPVVAKDTIPELTKPNSKGYIINVKDQNGECLLVIKDKTGKEVKRLMLTEWNENAKKFEANYGEIPPPPPLPAPQLPENVKSIEIKKTGTAVVVLKNGQQEKYDFSIQSEKEVFEKKYGTPPPPPPPPPSSNDLPEFVTRIDKNVDWVEVWFKNGEKEIYDFKIPSQKEAFEKKYGNIIIPPPPPPPAKVEIREVPIARPEELKIQVEDKSDKSNIIEVPIKTTFSDIKGNPLIVVDGVIIKNGELDKINPNSIQSINVLKGNSAVTLYGEKGSNGVIIIKTKTNEKIKPITQTPFLFPYVKNDGC